MASIMTAAKRGSGSVMAYQRKALWLKMAA